MTLTEISSTPIRVEKLQGNLWKIYEPLIITLKIKEAGVIRLRLDAGLVTDFGSIPKIFQSWISDEDDNLLAFLMHDAGYIFSGLTRNTWDKLLRQALRKAGMGYWKALSVYQAVNLFGSSNFNSAPENQMRKVHLTWGDK